MAEVSPLLKLAAELRNKIYRLVLIGPIIDVTGLKTPNEPALLAACTQIRQEALQIYYSENTFRIYDSKGSDKTRWARSLGGHRVNLLEAVSLEPSLKTRAEASSARISAIELRMSMMDFGMKGHGAVTQLHCAAGVPLSVLHASTPPSADPAENEQLQAYTRGCEQAKEQLKQNSVLRDVFTTMFEKDQKSKGSKRSKKSKKSKRSKWE